MVHKCRLIFMLYRFKCLFILRNLFIAETLMTEVTGFDNIHCLIPLYFK